MKALIVVGDSNGQRRCDSKCYDASSPDCDCVCSGVNHGVGIRAAMDNTERMSEALIKEYKRQGYEISIPTKQETMFP